MVKAVQAHDITMAQFCGVIPIPGDLNLSTCTNNSYFEEHNNSTPFEIAVELYMVSLLCLVGLFGNIVAIVVLRKDRERREALFLLQALAVADAFYLLVSIFRYPLKYLMPSNEMYQSMQLTIFPLLKTAQAITIWMITLVTVDRYIYVCIPLRATQVFNSRNRRCFSCGIFVAGFIFSMPRFFDSCIMTFHDMCTGQRLSRFVYKPFFVNNAYYLDIYNYGLYILLLYLAPLVTLIMLNWRLISAIKRSKRRHREITALRPCSGNHHHSENNATLVLIIIVLVFIVCETPELILKVITFIDRLMGNTVMSKKLVHYFGTINELLMVFNSSVNFLVYCAFGKRFRHVMKETFKHRSTHATVLTHESVPLHHQQQQQQQQQQLHQG